MPDNYTGEARLEELGKCYVGGFLNGKFEGTGTLFQKKLIGTKKWSGEFKDGALKKGRKTETKSKSLNGKDIVYTEDSEGSFDADKLDGAGKFVQEITQDGILVQTAV